MPLRVTTADCGAVTTGGAGGALASTFAAAAGARSRNVTFALISGLRLSSLSIERDLDHHRRLGAIGGRNHLTQHGP